jgi:rare lipoprotein A
MSSIDAAANSLIHATGRTRRDPPLIAAASVAKSIRLMAVVLGAASLAACTQHSVVSQRSQVAANRQASLDQHRTAASAMKTRIAAAKKRTQLASRKPKDQARVASEGIASFYSEDTETASGEKFNKHDLTAAHPTLPFGTKLRVTNVKTGRSVTVRVNDRGPYVQGRIVDVSYSAAEQLDMVNNGLANVRLDVMR